MKLMLIQNPIRQSRPTDAQWHDTHCLPQTKKPPEEGGFSGVALD